MMKLLWLLLLLLLPLAFWLARGDEALSHSPLEWKELEGGLFFSRIDVLQEGASVEVVAAVKIDATRNAIRVFNSYDGKNTVARTIEEWQKHTSAVVVVNGSQYMADPYLMPVALVIADGKEKGPKQNKSVRGMLLAEPLDPKLPPADLLDFDFDKFEPEKKSYGHGIQHWPILLDRKGKVKVDESGSRANRTVVAKDRDGYILFFTTERGFFTLHQFGDFLRESNHRTDKGFDIHTAMNLDGGSEANMMVKSKDFSYLNYGQFKTYQSTGSPVFPLKVKLPGVIAVFPR